MMIRSTMTLWLVLYNIELDNQGFKVDNFYVFISLVSTKEERRAAFKKAKNNLRQRLSGFCRILVFRTNMQLKHEGFVHSVERELRGLYSTERSSLGGLLHHCRA